MKECNIILAGVGGQGVLRLSNIIGEASLIEGKEVLISEIHGMAQRGGIVVSTVRIGKVYSPLIPKGDADLLLGLEPLEAYREIENVSKRTIVIVNENAIPPISAFIGKIEYPDLEKVFRQLKDKAGRLVRVDADELALKSGSRLALNIVMLGVAFGLKLLPLSEETLKNTISESVPKKFIGVNIKAFEEGVKFGEGLRYSAK